MHSFTDALASSVRQWQSGKDVGNYSIPLLVQWAITDYSQSAKYIHRHYKSEIYVEVPGWQMPILILPNGLNEPGERARACQKLISHMVEIQTHNLLTDRPASYRGAITAHEKLSPVTIQLLSYSADTHYLTCGRYTMRYWIICGYPPLWEVHWLYLHHSCY